MNTVFTDGCSVDSLLRIIPSSLIIMLLDENCLTSFSMISASISVSDVINAKINVSPAKLFYEINIDFYSSD